MKVLVLNNENVTRILVLVYAEFFTRRHDGKTIEDSIFFAIIPTFEAYTKKIEDTQNIPPERLVEIPVEEQEAYWKDFKQLLQQKETILREQLYYQLAVYNNIAWESES